MSVSSCAGGVSFFCFKAAVVVYKAPFADPFSFSLSRALATISKTPFADLFSSFPLHIYGDDSKALLAGIRVSRSSSSTTLRYRS